MCIDIEKERPGGSHAKHPARGQGQDSSTHRHLRCRPRQARRDYKKTRVLRAFQEWEQTSIAKAVDPDWDADRIWDMASNEAPLTDLLYKVSDSIDQHFVCRSKDCLCVIHNHHWLRQISWDYLIAEQHGALLLPPLPDWVPALGPAGQRIYQCPDFCSGPRGPHHQPRRRDGLRPRHTPGCGTTPHLRRRRLHALICGMGEEGRRRLGRQARDFGAGDFRSKLVGALRDEQMKHQKLPYFEATRPRGPR